MEISLRDKDEVILRDSEEYFQKLKWKANNNE